MACTPAPRPVREWKSLEEGYQGWVLGVDGGDDHYVSWQEGLSQTREERLTSEFPSPQ